MARLFWGDTEVNGVSVYLEARGKDPEIDREEYHSAVHIDKDGDTVTITPTHVGDTVYDVIVRVTESRENVIVRVETHQNYISIFTIDQSSGEIVDGLELNRDDISLVQVNP